MICGGYKVHERPYLNIQTASYLVLQYSNVLPSMAYAGKRSASSSRNFRLAVGDHVDDLY